MKDVPYAFLVAILIGSLAVIGCDTNEVESNEIVDISMSPESATIEVGETMDFSVEALTASGETVQATDHDVRWWSRDTTVFKVGNDGTAIGQDAGSAYCIVEVNTLSKTASALFVGRDSARVMVF